MSQLAQRLEEFVLENGHARGRTSIDPDDDLLASGILDSVGITQLVTLVEEEFGVEVGDEDLTAENFGSIRKVLEFVESKNGAAA